MAGLQGRLGPGMRLPLPQVGFLREFEKVVTEMTSGPEPNFLGKACARWTPRE
jgi:hypothetical protein